jgi:sn-glycerol 3-phosphate transport system permease protein
VNWLGQPETALWAGLRGDHLEGGGVLHDLLPRRAADHPAQDLREAAEIEGASRWTYTRRVVLPAADADHAVRPGQCDDQLGAS